MWVLADGNELFNVGAYQHMKIKRSANSRYYIEGYTPGLTFNVFTGTKSECDTAYEQIILGIRTGQPFISLSDIEMTITETGELPTAT